MRITAWHKKRGIYWHCRSLAPCIVAHFRFHFFSEYFHVLTRSGCAGVALPSPRGLFVVFFRRKLSHAVAKIIENLREIKKI